MNTIAAQVFRLLTGTTSVLLVAFESSLWWIAVIPWAMLCIFGILATIPALFVVGIGAGAAQADWMSDAFVIGLLFVTPTMLAVAISEFFRRRGQRRTNGDRILGVIKDSTNKPAQQDPGGEGLEKK